MDNVIIERLWRSVKHEWVLLHEYNTLPELERISLRNGSSVTTLGDHTQLTTGKRPGRPTEEFRPDWNAANWARNGSAKFFMLSAKASSMKNSQSAA